MAKILLVDDERIVCDFLIRLLNFEGLDVKAVYNGQDAINLVKKEKFDIIFLDIRMPGLDGVETLKRLKTISPGTKYFMMTGYAVDDMLDEAKREGAIATLIKPFDIGEINALIQKYINK